MNIRMSFPQKYQWCITDKERIEKDWLLINNKNFMLALFDPGGIVPSSHVFAFNWTNTRTRVLKNLAFPNYEYGKGQYAFNPLK